MRDWLNHTHVGDCRDLMRQMIADGVKVQCIVTSPPYWGLRDYDNPRQFGLERNWTRYVARARGVFRLARELLAEDGVLWLNLGDSYANVGKWGGFTSGKHVRRLHGHNELVRAKRDYSDLKGKDLIGMPWRVAFALQADGWFLRSDVIWHKPNPMPESVTDRPTKAHEYVFMLTKSGTYYYDADAIAEPVESDTPARAERGRLSDHKWCDGGPGDHTLAKVSPNGGRVVNGALVRNVRTVWTIPTEPFSGAHFATFPQDLVARCILATTRPGDAVLDMFHGSGTVGQVATNLAREFIGCELNPQYVDLQEFRRTTIGMPI